MKVRMFCLQSPILSKVPGTEATGGVVITDNPVFHDLPCNDGVCGYVKPFVELSSILRVDLSDVQCI
jgi:hypothetical protein